VAEAADKWRRSFDCRSDGRADGAAGNQQAVAPSQAKNGLSAQLAAKTLRLSERFAFCAFLLSIIAFSTPERLAKLI